MGIESACGDGGTERTRYNCHIFFGENICLWRQRSVQDKICGHNFVPALHKKVKLGNCLRTLEAYIQSFFNRTTPIGTFKKFGSTDTSICDKTSVGISFYMRIEIK